MSYYQLNKKEMLLKRKDRYCKNEAADYYLKIKEVIKEKSKNWYKNLRRRRKKLQKKKKTRLKAIKEKDIRN